MRTKNEILKDYVVVAGIIMSPGRFQGAPTYVPFYWELGLDGNADADDGETYTFKLDASDLAFWPELEGCIAVRLWTDDLGFVKYGLEK